MPLRELCVAIPVGGVVNETYLEHNLKLLRDAGCLIYVGIDTQESMLSLGNDVAVRYIVEQYADKVMEFPAESYYRPGSIWKKIFDCWKDSGAPYVRALGYDDYLPIKLIREQHAFMMANPGLDASYSNMLIVDELINQDTFVKTCLSHFDKVRQVGKNPFSFICWEMRAEYILQPQFERMLMLGCANFECLMHAYLFRGDTAHFNSVLDGSAVRREHKHTISYYAQTGVLAECEAKVRAARDMTGYSAEKVMTDWHSLNFPKYVRDIRREISPFIARLAELEDKIRGVPYHT